jgi:hypothetical protein
MTAIRLLTIPYWSVSKLNDQAFQTESSFVLFSDIGHKRKKSIYPQARKIHLLLVL